MAKIDVSKVAQIIKRNMVSPAVLRKIIEEMNLAVQPDSLDEEKEPPVKKKFVILVSDPQNRLPKEDFVGWVLQLPESDSVATVPDRVLRSAEEYHSSKKGRMFPVKTVGEAIENVPAKTFKDSELWVKTKVPVLVLRTDNCIPQERSFI